MTFFHAEVFKPTWKSAIKAPAPVLVDREVRMALIELNRVSRTFEGQDRALN